MTTRWLGRMEQVIADKVFQGTIPYSRVRITDAIGLYDKPYTLVYTGGGGGFGGKSSDDWDEDHWHINVGKVWFPGLEKFAASQALLIHEMTHVWQSAQSLFPSGYIFNSVWHQLTKGKDAYKYSPEADWHTYNVEQQAHIVEDWFKHGMQPGDDNFRYVRDNIRAAKKFK